MGGWWGKERGGPVDSWMRASFRGFLRREAIVGDGLKWLPFGASTVCRRIQVIRSKLGGSLGIDDGPGS